jgi:F0F1-type ATP synthase assembly protein I
MSMAGMGFELAGAVAGFSFLGLWLDRHYGTEPRALLICAAIGVVGGLYNFIRAARIAAEAANAKPGKGGEKPEPE